MDCTDGEYHSEEGRVSWWSVVGNNHTELLDVGREYGRVDPSSMDSVMSELDKGYLPEFCGGGRSLRPTDNPISNSQEPPVTCHCEDLKRPSSEANVCVCVCVS